MKARSGNVNWNFGSVTWNGIGISKFLGEGLAPVTSEDSGFFGIETELSFLVLVKRFRVVDTLSSFFVRAFSASAGISDSAGTSAISSAGTSGSNASIIFSTNMTGHDSQGTRFDETAAIFSVGILGARS